MPSDLTPAQQREADHWNDQLGRFILMTGHKVILNPAEYAHVVALGVDPALVDQSIRL